MHRQVRFGARRLLTAVALALSLIVFLSGLPGHTAHAASREVTTLRTPLTTILHWSGPCGSRYCSAIVGEDVSFPLRWESGHVWWTGFTAHWGDGSYDNYVCGFNCSSGSTTFQHFWNSPGNYNTYASSSDGPDSNAIGMTVYLA